MNTAIFGGAIATLAACTTLGAVLVRGIVRVVRAERQPAIATLRAAAEQHVALDRGGAIAVYAWTRRHTAAFRAIELELRSGADGAPVPGSRSWLHENEAALGARRRVKLWNFDVPAAGDYRLRLRGLPDDARENDTELLFAPAPRDATSIARLAPRIVALVLTALLGFGALLAAIFAWHGRI